MHDLDRDTSEWDQLWGFGRENALRSGVAASDHLEKFWITAVPSQNVVPNVLDIACGNGVLARYIDQSEFIQRSGGEYTGVDSAQIKPPNSSSFKFLKPTFCSNRNIEDVQFNSDQFNNSKNTIDSFTNNKELSMAFLFQLVNIQIFPNDRLNALVQFWDFAKQNNLEEIAYKLSNNMLASIEATAENIIFGPKIASAYIFNNNFEKALAWIELYENAKEVDTKSIYTRVLLDLYSTNTLDSFINSLNLTLVNYIDDQNNENEELFFVLKDVMNLDIKANTNINLDKIFDERLMPSILLYNEIKNSIVNNNDDKFLIYSIISLNNKNWDDIHPEHLKLILKGYLQYKDGVIFRNIILEVFKNYKFII